MCGYFIVIRCFFNLSRFCFSVKSNNLKFEYAIFICYWFFYHKIELETWSDHHPFFSPVLFHAQYSNTHCCRSHFIPNINERPSWRCRVKYVRGFQSSNRRANWLAWCLCLYGKVHRSILDLQGWCRVRLSRTWSSARRRQLFKQTDSRNINRNAPVLEHLKRGALQLCITQGKKAF